MTSDTSLDKAGLEAARIAWLESASDYKLLDVSIEAAVRSYLSASPLAPVAVKGEVVAWRVDAAEDEFRLDCQTVHISVASDGCGYAIYRGKEWVPGKFSLMSGPVSAAQEINEALSPPLVETKPLPAVEVAELVEKFAASMFGKIVGVPDFVIRQHFTEFADEVRASLSAENTALKAERDGWHRLASGRCGCQFADDGETLVAECGYHSEVRETAEASLTALREKLEKAEAALKETRSHFIVEHAEDEGRKPAIGYDSEALPKIIAILDSALATAEDAQ